MSPATQTELRPKLSHAPDQYDTNGAEVGDSVKVSDIGIPAFLLQTGAYVDGDIKVEFETSTDDFASVTTKIEKEDVDGNLYDEVIVPSADDRLYQWTVHRQQHDSHIRAKITVANATGTNGVFFSGSWLLSELRIGDPVAKNVA